MSHLNLGDDPLSDDEIQTLTEDLAASLGDDYSTGKG